MNKKIVIGIAIVLVVVMAVAVVFLFFRPSLEQKELDFTISGESPEIVSGESHEMCYVPFRTCADEQWNLTIECLEMPSVSSWVSILLYNEYWDKGTDHRCQQEDIYSIATELTELERIGVDPEALEEYPFQDYNTTVYTGIYGSSTDQSFTVFFAFPSGGIGKFHVKLEKVE